MASVESVLPAAGAPILVLEKLDKRFGATHAPKAGDLTFEEGEIHAIVGENGAGKSTLIKLLTGVYPRTSGVIYWRGAPVPLVNPHEAIGLGINAGHQEVVLCPHLTVAANIFLGDEEMRPGLLRHGRMTRDAQKLLDELGFLLPADVILSSLTIGLQRGAGIVMISSYLPEVFELADTLHVFRAGTIVASHGHKDASHETILTEAIGV
ncbi:MAG: ATP-binding cassette domain-containing protein [Roseiarcus sp.]